MNAATRICLLRFASNAMCTLNKLCGILVTFRINLQRITNMHTINNTIRLLVDQSIAVKLVVMTQLGTNQVKFDPETPTKTINPTTELAARQRFADYVGLLLMGKRVNCRTHNLYCELMVKSDNLHS